MASNAAVDARRVAVIDIGSNTVLLLVRDRSGPVLEEARITRLGQGTFETGQLDAAAIRRTRDAVRAFATRARAAGARTVVGVGTEALRTADDGREFLMGLCEEGALDRALLLTGQEEAELSVETNRRRSEAELMAVIDVGGGSTELAWTSVQGGVLGLSGPLGSVRYTEAFLPEHPIPGEDLRTLRERVREQAEVYPALAAGTELTAVAGTATTLAALELALDPYLPERVEGYRTGTSSLEHWIARLAALSVPERRRLPGLEPGRADVIVAGLVILAEVLQRVGVAEFRVSGLGVRHGVALRLLDAVPVV